jgi:photosystem II stability/assembly factor-like uncharacterized protein
VTGRLARPAVLAAVALGVFCSGASAAAPNTWRALGPSAAQVLALAASPDSPGTLYGATEDGVWKSTNSGDSWAPTGAGPTALAQSMAADPGNGDRVVAAATSCKVWASSNGGSTWGQAVTAFAGAGSCTPHLSWTSAGLFALARGTLYQSNDGGLHWSSVGSPPGGSDATALLVLPTAPATIYVPTELGTVQRSANGGTSWADRSSGLPTSPPGDPPPAVTRLVADPADEDTLFAEVDNYGLFATTDAGLSWAAIDPPAEATTPLTFPAALATTPTTILAAAGATLFRSSDGGTTWVSATKSPGGLGSGFATGLFADPGDPSAVYLSGFGVYRSVDAGETFEYAGSGLAKATVHAIEPVPGSLGSYLVATEGVGIQRTDDDGESWEVRNDGVIGQTLQLAADPSDSDTFFMEGAGHLWKTSDGGAHWATSDAGIPYGASAIGVDPNTPSKVYTAQLATVYRSTDGGASWPSSSALPAPGGTVRRLVVDPTNSDRVYAGTNAAFYRSSDGGVTWTRLHTDYVYDVDVAIDGDVFVSVDPHILRFTPTGTTPVVVPTGLDEIAQTVRPDPRHAETVYAGTVHGLYETVDGGGRWAKLTTAGLDSEFVTGITSVADGHLMVSCARGTAAIDLAGPSAGSASADQITQTSARLSGSATPAGFSASAFFEYGTTAAYGSTTAPTALGSGVDPVPLSTSVASLSPGATYHYRLVVQSGGGVAVSDDATFSTPPLPPTASTVSSTVLSVSSVRVTGFVNPRGTLSSYWFEYGPTASYGSASPSTSAGAGNNSVTASAEIAELAPETTYHFRLVAENAGGTAYGADKTFTMPPSVPSVTTNAPLSVSPTGALLYGHLNPNGQAASYWFEYGPTDAYGQATPESAYPASLFESGVTREISGLAAASSYHYRLVAESAGGTSYGQDQQFTTASLPPSVDSVSVPVLRSGRLSGGAVPLALSWAATPGTAAICSYDVERGTETAGPVSLGSAQGSPLRTSAKPARGLYYRVRAHGCDDTVSADSESAPVSLRLLQESSPAVQRSGGWTRVSVGDASGGYVLRTSTPDARLTFHFTGRAFAFVGPKGKQYGAVSVRVDGAAATSVSLYRSSRLAQAAVYVVNFSTAGDHNVVLRSKAMGQRRRVDVDAFAVIG